MDVLVTGGAGYIGSHVVRELIARENHVTVLDNLSHGHRAAVAPEAEFVLGSTGDLEKIQQILKSRPIEAVLHFAADIEVGESVTNPAKYYRNNFVNAHNLLETVTESGVRKFVFSSTAAVYGNPVHTPIVETDTRAPINPYGRSKMMVELALEDYRAAYGIGYVILRYFNVAGAHPDGTTGEDHHPESHLIPRVLQSARDGETVRIFGTDYATADGTCVRDYVHVMDLARAHVLALEKLQAGEARLYNIGSEKGFSVREVLAACEKITKRRLRVEEVARRPGDPASLVASSVKIREELGWKPHFPGMESIVADAWRWHTNHPNGYSDENAGKAASVGVSPSLPGGRLKRN